MRRLSFDFRDPFCYAPPYMELLKNALPWVQVIVSILMIGLILLQRSGSELGGALGGGDGSSGTVYTRRGFEKVLFYATIALAVVFVLASFAAKFIAA